MVVILNTNNSLIITKLNMIKMAQARETRLSSTNLNVRTSVSPNLKLSTSVETSHDTHPNLLYSTPLMDAFVSHHHSFSTVEQDKLEEAVNKMKEIMMRNNWSKVGDDIEELIMIDTIQRLGIEHHFENEIKIVLERHYTKCYLTGQDGDDLHHLSLRFRLLRQQGYNVIATDTFGRFKDDDGKFKSRLESDIKGLISLFEASQLSIQGDNILDEANELSRNMLELYSTSAQHLEAKHIRNTLNYPFRTSLPRLMAKSFFYDLETHLHFLHNIKAPNGWTSIIHDVARKDLYLAQITHHNEISQFSRWWKKLNLGEELKRARDEPVKWYMWSLAALPSPNMGEERIQLTKLISLIYMMDDIFDVYGTLEDLTLFTKAINRWDYAEESLPDYLRIYFKALHDTTDEMSHRISVKYGWNPKEPIRQAWKDLCNAFLLETEWFTCKELPSSEEYLKNGIISSSLLVVSTLLFYLLGHGRNDNNIIGLNKYLDMATSTATILRLWDDLGCAKDENQDGNDWSFIECYLKEHEGSSIESARDTMNMLISNAWKCLNEKCLSHHHFSQHLIEACLNLARMVPLMYSYDDDHRLLDLERLIQVLLYDNIK